MVNPTTPKAFAGLSPLAGRLTVQAKALAKALAVCSSAKHHGWQPHSFYEQLFDQVCTYLQTYEFLAITELCGRPSGLTELQQHLAQPGLCGSCLNPRPLLGQVAKCRRSCCVHWLCAQWLCQDCVTESGYCYFPNVCLRKLSPWRAAIRVLQNSDHVIAQHWLMAARLADLCAEHLGRGQLPRLDNKSTATLPNNTCQTIATSQRYHNCRQTEA